MGHTAQTRNLADFQNFIVSGGRIPSKFRGLRGDFGAKWWDDFLHSITNASSDIPNAITTAAGATAATYDQLTDTPANKTGSALLFARVNAGETAMEFASALSNLVEDTTPQLGGNLDVNNFDITSAPPATPTSAGGLLEILAAAGGATSGAGGGINMFAGAAGASNTRADDPRVTARAADARAADDRAAAGRAAAR